MTNTLTDSQRLQKVLDALDLTANKLSVKLNYASPAAIYHVLTGKNKLSRSMIEKIIEYYPSVNYKFLKSGEGEIILDDVQKRNQMNLFNIHEDKNEANADLSALNEKLNTFISLQQRNNELLAELISVMKNKP